MGFYIMVVPAFSRLNMRVEDGKCKWKYSKGIFMLLKNQKIA